MGDTPYDAVYIGLKGKAGAANGAADPAKRLDAEAKKIVAAFLLAAAQE